MLNDKKNDETQVDYFYDFLLIFFFLKKKKKKKKKDEDSPDGSLIEEIEGKNE